MVCTTSMGNWRSGMGVENSALVFRAQTAIWSSLEFVQMTWLSLEFGAMC